MQSLLHGIHIRRTIIDEILQVLNRIELKNDLL